MRKIVKKIPARTVIKYQCKVCGMKYKTSAAAKKCEARILENKKAKIGDRVHVYQTRECHVLYQVPDTAKVVKIIGPMLPWEDYEIRHLHGRPERLNSHIFQYEIEYISPCCKEVHRIPCFAPEFDKVSVRNEMFKKLQAAKK